MYNMTPRVSFQLCQEVIRYFSKQGSTYKCEDVFEWDWYLNGETG